jgi:hypothetical protein
MAKSIYPALFLALVFVLSACGGGANPADSPNSATVSAEAGEIVSSAPDDAPETGVTAAAEEPGDPEDVDLDTRLRNFEIALGLKGTAELVDDTTVRVTFDEGNVDIDSLRSCTIGEAFVDEPMTLVLVYPDGEMACE